MWIFGYGSLVWRPAFPHLERRPGFVRGHARRFWQRSTDHRGTPEAPGRVVTLVRAPDAVTWGLAYRVDAAALPEILAALDVREQQGYDRLALAVHLAPRVGAAVEATIDAVAYVASADNPHFTGGEPLDAIAAVVRRAHGPSGANREYVLELGRALAALGDTDPHVAELAARLGDDEGGR